MNKCVNDNKFFVVFKMLNNYFYAVVANIMTVCFLA